MSRTVVPIKFIFGLSLTILITSCCTKKDCDGTDAPRILVELDQGNPTTYEMFIYETQGNNLIDSAFGISGRLFLDQFDNGNLKGKKFVIYTQSGAQIDSISDIRWNVKTRNIDCNKCMLIINQKEKVNVIEDLQFNLNGIVIRNEETVEL